MDNSVDNLTQSVAAAIEVDPSIETSRSSGLGPLFLIVGRELSALADAHQRLGAMFPAAWIDHIWISHSLTKIRMTEIPATLAPLAVQRSIFSIWPVKHDSQLTLGYDLIVSTDPLLPGEREQLLKSLRVGRPGQALIEAPPLRTIDWDAFALGVTCLVAGAVLLGWLYSTFH